ncbi:uncharacterized protein LOC124896175 [Capsicum annuum]|uniref:uncharacterized protein LOC124896175 n=1 Tax=Capsicum annuum TaxID=4072 RepID=UPI001FB0F197|nr:uncharacterized protein LOC124896175 [Capsicum annuum]
MGDHIFAIECFRLPWQNTVLNSIRWQLHIVATPYHSQTSGKVEIKVILAETKNASKQDWSRKLDDVLWEYQKASKTHIGMLPYQLVYVRACQLSIELEHNVLWVLKRLNLNWNKAMEFRLGQLNEMDQFHLEDYESIDLYKEKIKKYHDRKIDD